MKIKMKIKTKLIVSIVALIVVSSTILGYVGYKQAATALEASGKADLEHLVAQGYELCRSYNAISLNQVKSALNVAREQFYSYGGRVAQIKDDKLVLSGRGTDFAVNDNSYIVDKVKEQVGGTCTIFQVKNGEAIRIQTNVVGKDGNRALGTKISDEIYDKVVRGGQSYFGRAWVVDDWYTAAYEPIRNPQGGIVGVLYAGVKEKDSALLKESLLHIKVGQTGYLYCMDLDGVLTVHPKNEGESIAKHDFAKEMLATAPKLGGDQTGWVRYYWDRNGKQAEKIVAYKYFPEWKWVVAAGSYMDEFTGGARKVAISISIISLITIGFCIILGWVLANSIIKPLHKMVEMIKDIAQGEGDLTKRLEGNDHDEIGELANWFNTFVDKLHDIISQVAFNTEQLASAANEISSSAEELSAGAKEQTNQTAQVSAAVEEMTATIVESSRNTAEAAEKAKGAAAKSQEGSKLASETSNGMNEIVESSNTTAKNIEGLAEKATAIGEIIKVIDDIADQTNLLALNAAIEAARAGEQGRGFAVVADEVRKLAERTTKATKEVAETIKGIQADVANTNAQIADSQKYVLAGRELVEKTNHSLNEIYQSIETVQEMMRQLATASEQQSAAAEQISKSIENVNRITKESAAGTEQAASASEELNRQAEELRKLVGGFKLRKKEMAGA
jgi:methyl-accepting chemotaxis protein